MKIEDFQVFFDEFSNIPYKLRPYVKRAKEDAEPDTIYVYNKAIGSKIPIEDKSIIVNELSKSKIHTRRIYADRGKYEILSSFLKTKYPQFF